MAKIYYDENGDILEVTGPEVEREGDYITVPDDKLADDFLETFALRRYRVRNGKLAASRSFDRPDPELLGNFVPQDLPVPAPKRARGSASKRSGGKKKSRKRS